MIFQLINDVNTQIDEKSKVIVLLDFKDSEMTLNRAIEAVNKNKRVIIVPRYNLKYWKQHHRESNGKAQMLFGGIYILIESYITLGGIVFIGNFKRSDKFNMIVERWNEYRKVIVVGDEQNEEPPETDDLGGEKTNNDEICIYKNTTSSIIKI